MIRLDFQSRARRRGRRRGLMVPAVVGRENAEAEFVAVAGVGGVAGRVLHAGGTWDGLQVLGERGGGGFPAANVLPQAHGVCTLCPRFF